MIIRIENEWAENNWYNLNHPADAEKFLEDLKTFVFNHESVTVSRLRGGVWRKEE